MLAQRCIWLALGLLLLGCSGSSGPGKTVSYQETARENYERGMAAMERKNYLDAIQFFTFVKNRFPFSRYSTLAELRIADAYFAQGKYPEAADAYRLFIRLHPSHPNVVDGYAAIQTAHAYVKQIPGSWFLAPPAHEKDQSATRDALRETTAFIQNYPTSTHLEKAKALQLQCIEKLVAHELYVAKFYRARNKPAATLMRLEGVVNQFPETGGGPEVLWLLGETYRELQQQDNARATFTALVEKYPADKRSDKARTYLRSIEGR